MWEAAENLNFEQAMLIDQTLNSLSLLEKNQDVEKVSASCADYLGFIEEEGTASVMILQVREGKLIGKESFLFQTISEEKETLEYFIWQYYDKAATLPCVIYLSYEFSAERRDLLERALREKSGRSVKILRPKVGRHFRLLGIAKENALLTLNTQKYKKVSLKRLADILSLANLPKRIEGIDIAHIDGKYPVGVVVSFWQGKPDKSAYRLYNLRSVVGKVDDYKAIKEVIVRHYGKGYLAPDLLLIDGGKGQLNAAVALLKELEFDMPVCALAKRMEEIFISGQKQPIILPKGDQSLAILQAVRDEAHRFATKQNRKLMGKRLQQLEINQIPGIGPKRARLLLENFSTFESLQEAKKEDLEKIQDRQKEKLILKGNVDLIYPKECIRLSAMEVQLLQKGLYLLAIGAVRFSNEKAYAEAETLRFDRNHETLELIGQARLQAKAQRLQAERIWFNLKSQQLILEDQFAYPWLSSCFWRKDEKLYFDNGLFNLLLLSGLGIKNLKYLPFNTGSDSRFYSHRAVEAFKNIDSSQNGWQVECGIGQEEQIKKVAFAVDACQQTIEMAQKEGANVLFVHHGFFWKQEYTLTAQLYKRVDALRKANMGLYAMHLPLDADPVLGHNAQIARLLNLQDCCPLGETLHQYYHNVKESAFNMVSIGHCYSERWGMLALAKKVKEDWQIPTCFLECETGL
ncbi:UNVERIFIED_CONTAM: hypothetical protein PYX00_011064 [Menopon gallinae]|uniref:NIF3-like protein 1 n=1 Tax=Menopon gallinae TaxID=328185 RepID=A0AAW2H759_9NEOP